MPSVVLTPASTGVSLYNNPINLTPNSAITIQPNRTNATVSFNCYVGYASYYSGRYYTFSVTMNCSTWAFSQTVSVTTYPTSNRGWVSCTFTIPDTGGGFGINSFTLTQTYRYNSNYNANIRPNSEAYPSDHYVYYDQGSVLYTKVYAPGSIYWDNTGESSSILVPPLAERILKWSSGSPGTNTTVSGYEVYRSTTSSGTYTLLGTTTGTQYTVTGPSSGSYYYKIKSKSSPTGYDSEMSSSSAYMTVSVGTLSAPSNVELDTQYLTTGSTTTLRWDPVSNATNNNVTGYTVYKTVGSTKTALGTTTTTSYTVTAESSGNATYTVKANGQYSDSVESSSVILYTYTLPTAPNVITLSQNQAAPGITITLSWSGAQNGVYNNISSYEIYYSTNSTSGFTKYGNTLSANASSTTVVSSSTQGETYYYKVRVLGERPGYSDSSTVYVTTYSYSAVGAPSTVSVSPNTAPSGGSAILTWSAGTDNANVHVSSYQVWRCDTQDGTYEKLGNNTNNREMTVYAPSSGSYYYKVQSIADISGYDSALSSVIAVLSVNTSPSTPENFSVTPYNYNTGDLTFGWNASTDPEGDTVTYTIYITYNNLSSVLVSGISSTSYTEDLTNTIVRGTNATFYVIAVDSNNNASNPSNTVTVTRVESVSPEDVEIEGYIGSGTYSYHPTVLVKANKKIKALSTYEFVPIPYNTYVEQDEYILLKYQSSDIYDDFTDPLQTTTLQEKTYTGRVSLEDEYGNTAIKSITFKVMRDNYSGEQVGINLPIKASHINLLRTLLQNEYRFLLDQEVSYSDQVVAGVTSLSLWKTHITELRNLIDSAITSVNSNVANSIIPVDWEVVTVNKPKASVMDQLHEAIVNKL